MYVLILDGVAHYDALWQCYQNNIMIFHMEHKYSKVSKKHIKIFRIRKIFIDKTTKLKLTKTLDIRG